MILTIALLIILGLASNRLLEKIKLPGLLGMILLGILLGPYGLDLLFTAYNQNTQILLSGEFRMIALIIILLRAGLGIHKDAIRKVGGIAIRMSFIPCLLEGFAVMGLAMWLFDFPLATAGMLGFIIAAVSPAVIVPEMLELIGKGWGKDKEIPTLILSSASFDDILAITLFGSFLGLARGTGASFGKQLLEIPLSIVLGIGLGLLLGSLLLYLYHKVEMRNTDKVLLLLGVSFLFRELETAVGHIIPLASLIGIMSIGFIMLNRKPEISLELSSKLAKLWIFAQILLFVLIGASVNIQVALDSGFKGLLIILGGLCFRTLGVLLSLMGSELNAKERIFCAFAFLPKATVQAAIGAIPLAYGLAGGEIILAIAVLSILVSAPLGALLIRKTAPLLLSREQKEDSAC
jgi:NhaP-type Na+/H+ or K+/H+ antiporter